MQVNKFELLKHKYFQVWTRLFWKRKTITYVPVI